MATSLEENNNDDDLAMQLSDMLIAYMQLDSTTTETVVDNSFAYDARYLINTLLPIIQQFSKELSETTDDPVLLNVAKCLQDGCILFSAVNEMLPTQDILNAVFKTLVSCQIPPHYIAFFARLAKTTTFDAANDDRICIFNDPIQGGVTMSVPAMPDDFNDFIETYRQRIVTAVMDIADCLKNTGDHKEYESIYRAFMRVIISLNALVPVNKVPTDTTTTTTTNGF